MQDLIREGIARLAGASSQAVFHLKQAMGGGKTHLLVGFGLLAKHPELRKTYCAGLAHANAFESAAIAAFNGRNNPEQFFWGEIANQLGKGEQLKAFWTGGPKAPDEKDWLRVGARAQVTTACDCTRWIRKEIQNAPVPFRCISRCTRSLPMRMPRARSSLQMRGQPRPPVLCKHGTDMNQQCLLTQVSTLNHISPTDKVFMIASHAHA